MGPFHPTKGHRRPRVLLKAAMTLDGKIATRTGDSHVSSASDLKHLHRMRGRVDAVMIGIGTQLRDDPRLTVRRARGKNPFRVVVDSLARISPKSRILSAKDERTIIAVSTRAPSERIRELENRGASIIRCGSERVDLRKLLQHLSALGIKRVLLEGGGNLNWSMLESKLVDEIQVTLAPHIVGGARATTLVEGRGVDGMEHAIKLSLQKVTRNDGELVLSYEVRR